LIRLCILVEGQTEQEFVKDVLAPHLGCKNVFVSARIVQTSRDKQKNKIYRGGLINYEKVKNDLQNWLKEDKNDDVRFTTMFDLYALPDSFPAQVDAVKAMDAYDRVAILEAAFKEDIGDSRFIPYIQLHEFEALIFVSPEELNYEYLDRESEVEKLVAMAEEQNPELINDNAETAPSKRILELIPEYSKVSGGVATVGVIGLDKIRSACRHFDEWLTELEALDS